MLRLAFHGDGVIIGAVFWFDPEGDERPQLRGGWWEDPRRRRLFSVSRTSSIPASRHFSLQSRLSSAKTLQQRQVCAARVKSRGVRKLSTYRASSLGSNEMKSRWNCGSITAIIWRTWVGSHSSISWSMAHKRSAFDQYCKNKNALFGMLLLKLYKHRYLLERYGANGRILVEDYLSKGSDCGAHGSRWRRKMNPLRHLFYTFSSRWLPQPTFPSSTPTFVWSTTCERCLKILPMVQVKFKLTAPGLATSSFSEQGDSSLMDTLLRSLAGGAVGVDDVGVVGRGGGDWMALSLLRVCRSEVGLPTGSGLIRLVERRVLNRQAPHSLLLLLPLSFCWSSAAVSLELDITGVVLGVGWALVSLLEGQRNLL